MNKIITLTALIATLGLGGCSITNPVAFSNDVENVNKMGTSCQTGLFFAAPFAGNFTSIEEAKRDGGIKKISSIDQEQSFYFFFNRNCTVVRGS